MTVKILTGNCLDVLKTLPDQSVQCCVTSPPYFGLRSYFPDAVQINPNLPKEKIEWIKLKLKDGGVNAYK